MSSDSFRIADGEEEPLRYNVLGSFLIVVFLLVAAPGVCPAGTIGGSNFVSVGLDLNQTGSLYLVEEGTGFDNWGLMTFDFSSVPAGSISSNGTLTLWVYSTYFGFPLNATVEIDTLQAGYDPNSPGSITWASGQMLDTESFVGLVPGSTLTFTIPQATLISWANSPGTNYGVVLRETAITSAGASDLNIATTVGYSGPQLSFDDGVPEPGTFVLFVGGVAALMTLRRRRA